MTAPVTTTTEETVRGLLDVWEASLHHMDAVELDHEAQRVEAFPPSPAIARMRAAIDAERAARNGGGTHA
jgi:hypothetical protein